MQQYSSSAWFHRSCHQQEWDWDSHHWGRLLSGISASGRPSTILEPGTGETYYISVVLLHHKVNPTLQISPRSVSPRLSDRQRFPTFISIVPSLITIATGIVRLMQQFDWKHIAIITQEEDLFTLVSTDYLHWTPHIITFYAESLFVQVNNLLFSEIKYVHATIFPAYQTQCSHIVINGFQCDTVDTRCPQRGGDKAWAQYHSLWQFSNRSEPTNICTESASGWLEWRFIHNLSAPMKSLDLSRTTV